MRKFRVKVIALSIRGGNGIAKGNTIVTQDQLATNPDLLIKGGYIEEIKGDTTDEVVDSSYPTSMVDVISDSLSVGYVYEDITKAEIVDILTQKGVEFNKASTKKELFELL